MPVYVLVCACLYIPVYVHVCTHVCAVCACMCMCVICLCVHVFAVCACMCMCVYACVYMHMRPYVCGGILGYQAPGLSELLDNEQVIYPFCV